MVIDTPGQIEVFTWSASGSIITETLASTFPTIVVYVMDTARSTNPVTFMSNMLYACSILYKTKLPFIVVLNKVRNEYLGIEVQENPLTHCKVSLKIRYCDNKAKFEEKN